MLDKLDLIGESESNMKLNLIFVLILSVLTGALSLPVLRSTDSCVAYDFL